MSQTFVCSDTTTGAIDHARQTTTAKVADVYAPMLDPGFAYVAVAQDAGDVSDGDRLHVNLATLEVEPRPSLGLPTEIALIMAGAPAVFTLPAGTVVNGQVVEDTTLEISASMDGEYTLEFALWPYVDHTMEVTVHAA